MQVCSASDDVQLCQLSKRCAAQLHDASGAPLVISVLINTHAYSRCTRERMQTYAIRSW
jgi:hypothetical protein